MSHQSKTVQASASASTPRTTAPSVYFVDVTGFINCLFDAQLQKVTKKRRHSADQAAPTADTSERVESNDGQGSRVYLRGRMEVKDEEFHCDILTGFVTKVDAEQFAAYYIKRWCSTHAHDDVLMEVPSPAHTRHVAFLNGELRMRVDVHTQTVELPYSSLLSQGVSPPVPTPGTSIYAVLALPLTISPDALQETSINTFKSEDFCLTFLGTFPSASLAQHQAQTYARQTKHVYSPHRHFDSATPLDRSHTSIQSAAKTTSAPVAVTLVQEDAASLPSPALEPADDTSAPTQAAAAGVLVADCPPSTCASQRLYLWTKKIVLRTKPRGKAPKLRFLLFSCSSREGEPARKELLSTHTSMKAAMGALKGLCTTTYSIYKRIDAESTVGDQVSASPRVVLVRGDKRCELWIRQVLR
eukprot:m.49668 g.49668  ORF g.49668 m.49668 type:complete len:414 (-) comp11112_c0_seq5:874-2115(-)